MGVDNRLLSTQTQTVKGQQLKLKRIKALLQINQSIKKKKMGEENGYSWFCWRRSPAYVAAPKEQPELNASPLQRELPSPLQRASGTVLVELVELPVGPVAISNPDTNNKDNNNERVLVNNVHLLNFLFKSSTIFRAGQGAGNFVEIETCPILLMAACLPIKKK